MKCIILPITFISTENILTGLGNNQINKQLVNSPSLC